MTLNSECNVRWIFLAVTALVLTGSIIGAGCGIKPKRKDDWLVIPNLWGGIVAEPGSLKSPAIDEAMRPLRKLEQLAKDDYEKEFKSHEMDKEAYQAKRDVLREMLRKEAKKTAENITNINSVKEELRQLEQPDNPSWRRYKTNDATIEKIGELLRENPRGLLLYRDELIGTLASWERDGRQQDRAFYLESWNGYGSFTADRIGRGTIYTENLCISIFGGIQPSKLEDYLQQAILGSRNDGLIQRFQLLVYPDPQKCWGLVDEHPNYEAGERYSQIVNKLAELDFLQHGALTHSSSRFPFYHFNNDAQELFFEWLTELEKEKLTREEEPIILEHLAKYRSLMPSLALIIHLIDIADGQLAGEGVSFSAAKKAAAWCEYLESHVRRIYGLITNASATRASILLEKLKNNKLQDGFTVREIYRQNWRRLNDRNSAQAACDELVDANILLSNKISPKFGQPGVSGRGKTEYYINPKSLRHG